MSFPVWRVVPLLGLLALASEARAQDQHQDQGPERFNPVIPQVEFVDTPLADAVAFLVARSQELDLNDGRGVNVVVLGDLSEQRITLNLTKVPLRTVLGVVAELAGAGVTEKPEALVIARGGILRDAMMSWTGSDAVERKLHEIRLPSIEFTETPLRDALDFLVQRSRELDLEPEDDRQGVNLVLRDPQPVAVSLRLQDVSLYTALEMVALTSGYRVDIREHFALVGLEK